MRACLGLVDNAFVRERSVAALTLRVYASLMVDQINPADV